MSTDRPGLSLAIVLPAYNEAERIGSALDELFGYLHRRGVLAKLRRSAGQDVEAGCGQLRARHTRGARPAPQSAGGLALHSS